MPDIAMCMNKNCSKAQECYRFMAIADELQTYVDFKNICVNDDYAYFWTIGNKKIREKE